MATSSWQFGPLLTECARVGYFVEGARVVVTQNSVLPVNKYLVLQVIAVMTLDMKHSNRDRSPANHHGNAESRALQVIAMQRRNFLT